MHLSDVGEKVASEYMGLIVEWAENVVGVPQTMITDADREKVAHASEFYKLLVFVNEHNPFILFSERKNLLHNICRELRQPPKTSATAVEPHSRATRPDHQEASRWTYYGHAE